MGLNHNLEAASIVGAGALYDAQNVAAREWLTVEQAADYLQLSQSSIRSYIRQGRLEARRIAGKRKVLIHRSELLKLLEPARGEDLKISGTEQ
jgi:excisionase family DNA binding protein